MGDRTTVKPDPDPYQNYPNANTLHHPLGGGPDGHDSSPINPHLNAQHPNAPCHTYSPQQQSSAPDQTMSQYPNYPTGMGGNMSPMSPGYQANQRNQQYNQYPNDPQQYGQMGMPQQPYQGCHMGPPHGGREGDPYSFVDEYTGPSPRPVDEVLGNQQPKRRGRKPKHIKLMENG